MEEKRKKLLKKLLLITSAVLLLMLGVAGFLIWYIPQKWLNAVAADYMIRNQSMFRAASVSKERLNKLALVNPELGISGRELFTAPRGELLLGYDPRRKLHKPQFKLLRLFDVPLSISTARNKIIINKIKLEDFVKDLTRLPVAPDGKMIPLEINGKLAVNGKTYDTQLKLNIEYETLQKLKFSASWSDDGKHHGKWVAHLDLTNNNLTVALTEGIDIKFFKEILLRSGVPEKSIKLLHDGTITGSGQFSANYPQLQINNFKFSGKISDPELQWYKNKLKNVSSFEFTVNKNASDAVFAIPELTIHAPGMVKLRNIKLNMRSRRSRIAFSASCDLRQSMLNYFCSKLNIAPIPVNADWENCNGFWDTNSNKWHFSARLAPPARQHKLQLQSGNINGLQLIPGQAKFSADGNANSGKIEYQLDYSELAFRSAAVICCAERGKIYATARISDINSMTGDTLDIDAVKFSADTIAGQIELPQFSCSVNLRTTGSNTREIYLIANGYAGKLLTPDHALQTSAWQYTVNLENGKQSSNWFFNGMNFATPEVIATVHGNKYQLKNAAIRGNGVLTGKKFTPVGMVFSAQELTGGNCRIQYPVLDLTVRQTPTAAERCQTEFKCRNAQFPENRFNLRKLNNAEITFAAGEFFRMPQTLELKAESLSLQNKQWTCDMLNSSWQIKDNAAAKDVQIKFDSAVLSSEQNSFGSGSLSKGVVKLQLLHDRQTPQKINIELAAQQPVWQYAKLHTGGGSIQCSAVWQAENLPLLQGNFKITDGNILNEKFSVIAPELSCKVLAESSNSISGELKLHKAAISSPQGKLELRDSEVTLPWLAANKAPKSLKKGKLTARNVFFDQQQEGDFSAELEHFLQLDPPDGQAGKHVFKLNGIMQTARFGNTPLTVNSQWDLPPAQPAQSWRFYLPEAQLQIPLELHKYLPLPSETVLLKGKFKLQGQLNAVGTEPPRGAITLTSRDSDWQVNSLFLEGVSSNARINLQRNQISIEPHTVRADKLLWSKWLLQDNEFNLTLTPDWQLLIAGWHGKCHGGKFQWVMPVKIDKDLLQKNANINIPPGQINVQDLPTGNFFGQLGIKYIHSNIKVSGSLYPRIENNRLFFDESTLSAKTPAGELLQLNLPDQNMIKIRDKQYQAFTLAVLKAMKCTQTQFTFTTDSSEVNMRVKADGTPAEPVPFVYQGRGRTPFRPAQPGEKGFDGEIELNINLKLRPDNTGL